jgi:hypothetical protein
LMVPSIAVMPREGSFALAFLGRTRKVQEPALSLSAGRKSFALKRIKVLVIWLVSLIGLILDEIVKTSFQTRVVEIRKHGRI